MTVIRTPGICGSCKQKVCLLDYPVNRPAWSNIHGIYLTTDGRALICTGCGAAKGNRQVHRYGYPVIRGWGFLSKPGVLWHERVGLVEDSVLWREYIRQKLRAAIIYEREEAEKRTVALERSRTSLVTRLLWVAAVLQVIEEEVPDEPYYRMLEAAE